MTTTPRVYKALISASADLLATIDYTTSKIGDYAETIYHLVNLPAWNGRAQELFEYLDELDDELEQLFDEVTGIVGDEGPIYAFFMEYVWAHYQRLHILRLAIVSIHDLPGSIEAILRGNIAYEMADGGLWPSFAGLQVPERLKTRRDPVYTNGLLAPETH